MTKTPATMTVEIRRDAVYVHSSQSQRAPQMPPSSQADFSSPLLRLPAELRNKIYTLVCHEIIVYWRGDQWQFRNRGIALLLTCQQTLQEAVPPKRLRLLDAIRPHDLERMPFNSRAVQSIVMDAHVAHDIADEVQYIRMLIAEDTQYVPKKNHWATPQLAAGIFPAMKRLEINAAVGCRDCLRKACRWQPLELTKLFKSVFDKPELEVVIAGVSGL